VDYGFAPGQFEADDVLEDHPSLWRYQAFFPSISSEYRISIGEGNTNLIEQDFSGRQIYFKDETDNPTGSFKDRGMSMALTMVRAFGLKGVVLPSAGNAAVSASAYSLAGNLSCRVYLPETIPVAFQQEIKDNGAEVILAGRTIAEAGAAMAQDMTDDWFNVSTLKEPYRVEGKKTMGLEIAEQLGWDFPDVVIYPTGGGTGLVGIWKAFNELRQLDWVRKPMPRMIAVQTDGCAPVVQAFNEDATDTIPWPNPETAALGLNVPGPIGGAWMLDVLRQSKGAALAISEDEIENAWIRLGAISETDAGPEAGVAWRGLEVLVENNWIKEGERVVLIITGDNRRYI
jgi:threonine synthase